MNTIQTQSGRTTRIAPSDDDWTSRVGFVLACGTELDGMSTALDCRQRMVAQ